MDILEKGLKNLEIKYDQAFDPLKFGEIVTKEAVKAVTAIFANQQTEFEHKIDDKFSSLQEMISTLSSLLKASPETTKASNSLATGLVHKKSQQSTSKSKSSSRQPCKLCGLLFEMDQMRNHMRTEHG